MLNGRRPTVPLPPPIAHGFWFYDPLWLRVNISGGFHDAHRFIRACLVSEVVDRSLLTWPAARIIACYKLSICLRNVLLCLNIRWRRHRHSLPRGWSRRCAPNEDWQLICEPLCSRRCRARRFPRRGPTRVACASFARHGLDHGRAIPRNEGATGTIREPGGASGRGAGGISFRICHRERHSRRHGRACDQRGGSTPRSFNQGLPRLRPAVARKDVPGC